VSLINKMLQELDRRHAAQAGAATAAPASAQIARNIRSVKEQRFGSDMFWWVMAGAMLVAIAWLLWVMWQLTPHTVVNEGGLRAATRSGTSVNERTEITTGASMSGSENLPVQSPAVAVPEPRSSGLGNLPPIMPQQTPLDMLRLATEITTPIPARTALVAPRVDGADMGKGGHDPVNTRRPSTAASPARSGTASGTLSTATNPGNTVASARIEPSPTARASTPLAASPISGGVDKRNSVPAVLNAREHAEADYRRAMVLINQGRVSEGMEGLRQALAADGSYETARQTLVALLVEQRRMDDAVVVLQQGLDLNPANSSSAMLLARILVERQDLAGALALMQKHASAASGNADYHAFSGAIYQRLGRHKEAIDAYQLALRLSPHSGTWWAGLGISQEASGFRKDAIEAFRRARSAGGLSVELLNYVDQRLRQLQ